MIRLIFHIVAVFALAAVLRGMGLPAGRSVVPEEASSPVVQSAGQPSGSDVRSPRPVVQGVYRSTCQPSGADVRSPRPELPYDLFSCMGDTVAVRVPLLPPVRVRLLFAGDVMQHLPQVASARRADGSFDYGPCFAAVKPLFDAADLAIVNLETTLTTNSVYTGYPCFRSPAALAGALKKAGVDVCVLANNHCCDGGAAGARMTLAELDRCGMAHTGVFADGAAYRACNPLRLEAKGMRIALLNYTYGTNGIPAPKGIIVNYIDTVAMARDLRAARTGSDCVVVFIHWGNEYERRPNAVQERQLDFMRRHGADVVIGSHPHVVQPYRVDSAGVVFYSLGNFVSNQRGRYTDGGVIADVRITYRPGVENVYTAEAIPVWVSMPGYRILPPAAADMPTLPAQYGQFISDTRSLLYQ